MQTSYIYSVSRVNAASGDLLTKADIDRLLVARPGASFVDVLKETYLAPHLLQSENDIQTALDAALYETKQLLENVAPSDELLRGLWLQYDVHNLRVLAKSAAAEISVTAVSPYLTELGVYSLERLEQAVATSTLNYVEDGWQEAFTEAVRLTAEGKVTEVDTLFDQMYFTALQRAARQAKDPFIKEYSRKVIDLFNLQSSLRSLSHKDPDLSVAFVSGGSYGASELETKEQVLSAYGKLGASIDWAAAVQYYTETKNTTRLNVAAADYLLSLAREAAYDMFSSASLVLFYLRSKQSVSNIRAIAAGVNSGLRPEQIKNNVQTAYVD